MARSDRGGGKAVNQGALRQKLLGEKTVYRSGKKKGGAHKTKGRKNWDRLKKRVNFRRAMLRDVGGSSTREQKSATETKEGGCPTQKTDDAMCGGKNISFDVALNGKGNPRRRRKNRVVTSE